MNQTGCKYQNYLYLVLRFLDSSREVVSFYDGIALTLIINLSHITSFQEYGLYYESTTGTYFYYDKEKNTFQFHSQVNVASSSNDKVEPETNPTRPGKKRKEKTQKKVRIRQCGHIYPKKRSFGISSVRIFIRFCLRVHRKCKILKTLPTI